MRIADRLDKEQIKKLNRLKDQAKSMNKKDWLEVMGVNRDTYKRVNGRIRKK